VQDVPVVIGIVENGSTDGTREWLSGQQHDIQTIHMDHNSGVSKGWNIGLKFAFISHEHCLVLNQDVVLPSYFYRELLAFNVPFVTGCPGEAPDTRDDYDQIPTELFTSPCFSAFLIRRSCWETVGPFDEKMFAWASDCDYHVRAHLLGIKLQMAQVPFAHRAGTTLRTATPEMQAELAGRPNADRAVFKSKYGCEPGTPEYDALFAPELFGVKK
jgi:GT2 family glycosyltransferase